MKTGTMLLNDVLAYLILNDMVAYQDAIESLPTTEINGQQFLDCMDIVPLMEAMDYRTMECHVCTHIEIGIRLAEYI
jgi:hypothetical protein